MKKITALTIIFVICMCVFAQNKKVPKFEDQTIFVYGGNINLKFARYIVELTQKEDPKICFVPTASADNIDNIKLWEYYCKKLNIKSNILRVWISSDHCDTSFEEILLDMDAIVVGGGNTLNMLGIWKSQGIDIIMKKALEKGIILSGGSAGSLCWFQSGISDSRPVNLSVINGLSFLSFSHCPHYSDSLKKLLYHDKVKNKIINSGYACDDKSGILFRNGKYVETVSLNDINNSYYISLQRGEVMALKLLTKILINNNALPVSDYKTVELNKAVKEYTEIYKQDSPMNAFISMKYIKANGQESKIKALSCSSIQSRLKDDMLDKKVDNKTRNRNLNTIVYKVFVYNDLFAGVVNRMYDDYIGLWYFYKENGKWMSAGEDFGGKTVFESEIAFRERVPKLIGKFNAANSNIHN